MSFKRCAFMLFLGAFLSVLATAQGGPKLAKLGEWGAGEYRDVQVAGSYAYCAAMGAGLDIVDVSNPAAPVRVAGVPTRYPTYGVFVSGNYAYLAEDEGGLRIVNILDPLHPQVMSRLNEDMWDTRDVVVVGPYAYVVGWGLTIVDISNPLAPYKKCWLDTGGDVNRAVFVSGNYVYLGQESRMLIIDVSNPASPVQITNFGTYGATEGIWVQDNLAYVMDDQEYIVLNVSNPASPTEVHRENMVDRTPRGIYLVGSTLYLADDDLTVLDASSPANLHVESTIATPGTSYRVWVANGKAYVADSTHGLQIYNVAQPATPSYAGQWNASGEAHGLSLSGNTVYWADGFGGLRIMDTTNPAAIQQLGRYEKFSSVPFPSLDCMYGVQAVGNTAYALASSLSNNEVLCVNVAAPSAPTLTGMIGAVGWNGDTIAVSGNIAAMSDHNYGVRFFNVSNPAAPTAAGNYPVTIGVDDLCWGGANLYLANMDGVIVLGMANPASPVKLGEWAASDPVEGVFVLGNRAFVAMGEVGIKILDVTNPAAITVIGSFDTPGFAQGVFADERYVYVADGAAGVEVIDISTPSAPFLVDENETYDARDLAAANGRLYVADGLSGRLVVYEFSQKWEAWLPHVAPNWGWQTYLVIDNGGDQPCNVMVDLYSGGSTVSSLAYTVDPGKQASIPLLVGTCGHVVYSGSRVVVKEAFVSSQNGIAEFELDGATHAGLNYLLPNYEAANLSWMGLAAMNPNDADASVTFEAYDANGNLLGTGTHIIAARNTFVRFVEGVVTGVDFHQVARIRALASLPICGINISGFGEERLLFTQAQSAAPTGLLYMSHMGDDPNTWANRLIFDNTGTSQIQASVRMYKSGVLLRQVPVTVAAGRTVVLDLNSSSSADMADSGTVDAGGGFTFVRQSFTHKTEKGTAEFLLTNKACTQITYNYPGYVANRVQWMGLAVVNPSDNNITLNLTALKNGLVVATNQQTLNAHCRMAAMLEYIFPGHTFNDIERVIISCSTANITGINISGYGVSRLLFTTAFNTGVRAPDPGLDVFLGTIHKIYQSGFWVEYLGKNIYFDPIHLPLLVSRKADVIFLTHIHPDHLIIADLAKIVKTSTVIVTPTAGLGLLSQFPNLKAVAPDGVYDVQGIPFRTVSAYNLPGSGGTHYQSLGFLGFRLQLGPYSLYHAGDTDYVPEMLGLQPSVALLPVGGAPQVMTPAKAAEAAKALPADAVIPMHYDLSGSIFDAQELESLLQGQIRVVIKNNENP